MSKLKEVQNLIYLLEAQKASEVYKIEKIFDDKINKAKKSLKIIEEYCGLKICPVCCGKGYIYHMDAAGSPDNDDCIHCNKTGLVEL